MDVRIKHEQRGSLAMRVTPGGVEVRIPRDLEADSAQVQDFVRAGLARLAAPEPVPAAERLDRPALLGLVERWAERIGVADRVQRVQVRRMRHKWASISTAGNLTLARDLLELPRSLAEYVVVHELLHLRVPHHNGLFRLLLRAHLPDWRARERELARWTWI